jgi:eukaryotic-like serine/threonine-protein kinase
MSLSRNGLYRFDEFVLDRLKRTLVRDGVPVPLSPKAFEVLTCLVSNPGRVVTKEELLKAVWPESFVEEGNLVQHVVALRKAFADRAGYIVTVPGRGYQFAAEVHDEAALVQDQPGGVVVQTVLERTRIVVEESDLPPGHALPAPAAPLPTARYIGFAAAILAVAALVAWGAWRWHSRTTPSEYHQVVLADFVNTTGDAAFDRTLRRALEVDLEQSPYMDVLSERAGVGTLQMMGRGGDTPMVADVAREVCERTNRKILIEGSIASVGPEYLVTLQATDCSTGKSLSSAKAEAADKGRVLGAVDDVAERMRSSLGESAKSLASYQVPLKEATTPSLEALKAYSMGKYLQAQGQPDIQQRPFFEKAIDLDPHFAVAYGELSLIYYNNNDRETSKKYMLKAYQESAHVSARERFPIEAHYYDQGLGDVLRANEAYRVWGETFADEYVPWIDIANNDNELGLFQEAIPAAERALQLAPDRTINYSVLMRAYTSAGRFADAKRVYQLAMQRKKDSSGINEFRFNIAYAEQDQKAIAETDAWSNANPDDWYYIDKKAEAAATSGQYKEAIGLFRQAYDITKREKLDDSADGVLVDQAQVEAWFGLNAAAKATLARLVSDSSDGRDLVLIRTQLGDKTAAQRFVVAHKDESATLMKYDNVPQARAAAAAEQGKPLEAIAALEPARPYELESYSIPTQLAEIYLQAKDADQAAAQYKKILANPGIDLVCPQYPLAHLGLARVYAMQNKPAESRKEYEAFFALWKDADADLPILKQARLEYAQLPQLKLASGN